MKPQPAKSKRTTTTRSWRTHTQIQEFNEVTKCVYFTSICDESQHNENNKWLLIFWEIEISIAFRVSDLWARTRVYLLWLVCDALGRNFSVWNFVFSSGLFRWNVERCGLFCVKTEVYIFLALSTRHGSNPSNCDNKSIIDGWLNGNSKFLEEEIVFDRRLDAIAFGKSPNENKRKISPRNLRDWNVEHEMHVPCNSNCSAIHTLDFASSYSHVELSHRIRHMGHSSQLGSAMHRTKPIKIATLPKSMWNS